MKKTINFKFKGRRYSFNKSKLINNIIMLFIIAIDILIPIWGFINFDKFVTIW